MRLSGNQITILILIICLIAFYEFFFKPFSASLHNMAMADDAERARNLCDYISQKIKVSEKPLSGTNQPPMFWDASRNSARLEIYGITNSEIQEQIFEAAKEWQSTNQNLLRIRVQFFEQEKPRGEYGQHIETLLREEFIVLTNAQSCVIFNEAATKN
jgi:hypothetical protein